ncbi:hypothetical protein B0H19DRAFT_1257376 [Mycena capillaripes]|nr:hypothetical protein B0H19DRAFT_1257376 [Mycena capillaripes]
MAATLGVYALYTLLKALYQEFTSPLRNIPGPRSAHWLLGDELQIFKDGLWTAQYGRTVRISTFLGFSQLFTTDTKALQHILSNSYIYQKSVTDRYFLGRAVGPGALVVDHHATTTPDGECHGIDAGRHPSVFSFSSSL